MEKRGICALCKRDKKFMKAHIISKALFKSIFREHEKVHYVNVTDLETPNKVQDAFYDNALLCSECDNTFSPYEQYFADLISGRLGKLGVTNNLKWSYPPDYNVDVYAGIDPDKLRMFYLILIWRCSISKQTAFRDVELGSLLEDWLESQIKAGIPDSFETLSVTLFSLEDVDDIRKENTMMPLKVMIEEKPVILFSINGWIIVYNLEGKEIPFFEYRFQKENQLKIVRLSDEQGIILLDRITHLPGPFRKSLIDELNDNNQTN